MKCLFFVLLVFVSFQSYAASAEELTIQRIKDKLEKLEKDFNMIQKDVFKKGGKNTQSKQATYPKLEAGINALEEQIRHLNGQLEETHHNMDQLTIRMDKVYEDVEFRMSKIERELSQKSSMMPVDLDTGNNETEVPDVTEEKAEVNYYDQGLTFLRQAQYGKAEKSLKEFIKSNKESTLLGNAYYWLGETYYARKVYEQSAVNFLKGYQDFPKGLKAVDNLFKLGMSLQNLKKNKEACTTFNKIQQEFPDAEPTLSEKIMAEKKRLACS